MKLKKLIEVFDWKEQAKGAISKPGAEPIFTRREEPKPVPASKEEKPKKEKNIKPSHPKSGPANRSKPKNKPKYSNTVINNETVVGECDICGKRRILVNDYNLGEVCKDCYKKVSGGS